MSGIKEFQKAFGMSKTNTKKVSRKWIKGQITGNYKTKKRIVE